MIAKLECFSGHCHIAPDRLGLERLLSVWAILCAQHLPHFLEIPTPFHLFWPPPRLLKFPRNSDPPFIPTLPLFIKHLRVRNWDDWFFFFLNILDLGFCKMWSWKPAIFVNANCTNSVHNFVWITLTSFCWCWCSLL